MMVFRQTETFKVLEIIEQRKTVVLMGLLPLIVGGYSLYHLFTQTDLNGFMESLILPVVSSIMFAAGFTASVGQTFYILYLRFRIYKRRKQLIHEIEIDWFFDQQKARMIADKGKR